MPLGWYMLIVPPGKSKHCSHTQGKQIQHGVNLRKSVAIIHCKGHQKGNTVQGTGNKMTEHRNRVAEQAAEGKEIVELALIPDGKLPISEPESERVKYFRKDRNLINGLRREESKDTLLCPLLFYGNCS